MDTKIIVIIAAIATPEFLAVSNISVSVYAEGKLPESGFGQASEDLATSSPGATGPTCILISNTMRRHRQRCKG